MRCRLLLVPIIILGALFTGPKPAAAEDCRVGDELLAQGQLNQAQAVYKVLNCPSGLTAVIEQRRAAEVLAKSAAQAKPPDGDLPVGAKAEATAALALDAENETAQSLLTPSGPPQSDELCSKGDQALKDGDWRRAKELYETAKGIESANKCSTKGVAEAEQMRLSSVPARVEGLAVGHALPWLVLATVAFAAALALVASVRNRQFDRLGIGRDLRPSDGAVALAAIIATGVLACLVILAVRAEPPTGIERPFWEHERPGIALVGVGVAFGAIVALRRTGRRRLSFGEFKAQDDKNAAGLSALTAAVFAVMAQSPAQGIDIVRASDVAEPPVEQAATLAPNRVVKLMLALWKAAVPATDLTLDAQLVNDRSGRRSVSVALRRRGRTLATQTLVADVFALDPEAPTAQEEADVELDLATGIAAWLLIVLMRDLEEPRLYGAQHWEGLALNAAADRRVRRQDHGGAEALLARAIERDPRNVAIDFAWQNLRLRRMCPGDQAYVLAVQQLDQLYQTHVHPASKRPLATLPLGWRIAYAYGAAEANLSMTLPKHTRYQRQARARDVLAELAYKLQKIGQGEQDADRSLARDLLELTEAALLALRWFTLPTEVSLNRYPVRPRARHQYNLACAAAAVAERIIFNPARERELREVVVTRLRVAGENSSLRPLIRKDPWFHYLHNNLEWTNLLAEWNDPEDRHSEPNFARIEAVGKLASALADLGYQDGSHLRRALANQAQLQTIKDRTNADDRLVRFWSGALSWLEDKRISTDVINSVQRAGFADEKALANFPAKQAVAMAVPWHRAAGRAGTLDEATLTQMGAS